MRKYEVMFIVSPTLDDDGYKAVVADIEKVFTDNDSKVTETNVWGMRDLAYEIDDFKKGYYVYLRVDATPSAVLEYNRICNIREDILRHILVKEQ